MVAKVVQWDADSGSSGEAELVVDVVTKAVGSVNRGQCLVETRDVTRDLLASNLGAIPDCRNSDGHVVADVEGPGVFEERAHRKA